MAEYRDIKYVAREFSDYRQELIEFAKNYFPDSYNDFSPTSPGMMFIEMAAYVGDVLSFYQDTQLQETFLQYAKDPGNLYTLAYMMGYRPKVTTVAEVELEVSQNVAAVASTGTPNWDQALTVNENAIITSTASGNAKFLIEDNQINFPAIFIGDSRFDYEVAKRFNLDFIFLSDWTEFKEWRLYCQKNNIRFLNSLSDLLK